MEDEQEQPEPKISLPEVILIGLFLLLIDLVEIVIFFAGLDDFWLLDILAGSIFFYIFIKGVPPMRMLVAWLLELIPWAGALPLLTIGFGLTVWADRHPSGIVAKAGAVAGAAKGKGAARPAPAARGVGARSMKRMEEAERRLYGRLEAGEPAEAAGGATEGARAAAGGETAPAKRGTRGTELRAEAETGGAPQEAPPKPLEEITGEALGERPEPIEEAKRRLFEYREEEQMEKERREREEKKKTA
jgi:hypothetical protein